MYSIHFQKASISRTACSSSHPSAVISISIPFDGWNAIIPIILFALTCISPLFSKIRLWNWHAIRTSSAPEPHICFQNLLLSRFVWSYWLLLPSGNVLFLHLLYTTSPSLSISTRIFLPLCPDECYNVSSIMLNHQKCQKAHSGLIRGRQGHIMPRLWPIAIL